MKRCVELSIVARVLALGLALALLLLPTGPASATEDEPPAGTLAHYIVGSNNVDQLTATTLSMYHRGDWVELKGPITISVLVWHTDDPSTTTNTITIKPLQTTVIGVDEYSSTHPGD